MADVELLPLPSEVRLAIRAYARACVEANLAPLQAENERLRAEVEKVTCELMDATTRADRLAEALRRYRNEVPIGYQPHMLAHKVDDLLREQESE